ncbi:hypothetical protein [Actinoplanes couchii]|uniref:Uncharacterized protein n=1 Tax=Actinoplanes couchii TaxID=403638 RepID=A0ABQ3XEM6_9ACTN|nr:hypothetical protein [Actinoplanes couchii]MDR6319824.1 hypothetical protein [Actinoplanes couchii]GID56959.1 hypothetical protein Aco03nite_053630 [Actinoplanes couchii]
MIEIEYRRTGPYVVHGRENDEGVDLALVSRADLCWYYFWSDLSFTIGGIDLSPPWSWTPVFDLLWSMKGVLEHLEGGENSTIGFTENAELITFTLDGGAVRVSCTYTEAEAVCEFADLTRAWLDFRQAVLARLVGEYPRLAANPALDELAARDFDPLS